MNKLLFLLAAFFSVLAISASGDETNLFVRMKTPTNEFAVVAEPVVQSVNNEDLAESLGIKHWNFQLQIPDNWAGYSVDFRWFENGTSRDLGHCEWPLSRIDSETGNKIPGPYQERILLFIAPVDISTDDPWRNSARLRVFLRDYGQVSGSMLIENPFKKSKTGFATYGIAGAVRENQSNLSQSFEKGFKLISSGQNETNELRVFFNPGVHSINR